MDVRNQQILVLRNLQHPLQVIPEMNSQLLARRILMRAWVLYTIIAVIGSLIYGASLALVINFPNLMNSALNLTVASAAGWFVFGPLLILSSGKSPWTCAHVCMITMVYGEALLLIGAAINVVMWMLGAGGGSLGIIFNIAWVGLTNLLMMVVVSFQMRALGMALLKPVLLWLLVLNGVGFLVYLTLIKLV